MIPGPKLEPRAKKIEHFAKFGQNARFRQSFASPLYKELVQNYDIRPKKSSKIAILDAI